ncbi:MAG: type V CRISPR-associated endonuclease Cas1 [Bacilli bacterium]|nr:type V CRISPR-associated endonuclease Cas1 [Bacilli bacterium]
MMSRLDFIHKQIVLYSPIRGDKLSFQNDNLIIRDSEEHIKLQTTCYQLFAVFIIGDTTITTGLISRARKFGFAIALYSANMKLYEVIGSRKDSNTLLHRVQYKYQGLEVAKLLISNKIQNQLDYLKNIRKKDEECKNIISQITKHKKEVSKCTTIYEIMGVEGSVSRIYFSQVFHFLSWQGRRPRIKTDYINALLDIGYTILFEYLDAVLNIFGFDTYCGVLHTQFYMRKSLTCDIIEPFRVIIDSCIKRALGLNQFKSTDFLIDNHRLVLKWKDSQRYVSVFLKAIVDEKEQIFTFIQAYYRSFMRQGSFDSFPNYSFSEGKVNDVN